MSNDSPRPKALTIPILKAIHESLNKIRIKRLPVLKFAYSLTASLPLKAQCIYRTKTGLYDYDSETSKIQKNIVEQ